MFNVGSLVLSASRFKYWAICPSTSQAYLFDFLATAFEELGGVPKEIVIDNASTMMDKARTEYSEGKINPKFQQLADDFRFDIVPCVRARPNTKAKVENPMRIIDEIMTYNGLLNDEEELYEKMRKFNEQLQKNLDKLKLTQMSLHLDDYINKINDHQISVVDALYELTSKEVKVKDFNAANAMVKVAGFPHLKKLKDFDFDSQPKINKQQFLDFESLRFLENNNNIILIGNSGVGKTHLATSIGIAAAKKRVSTYFIKCQDLIEQLKKAYLENKLDSRIKLFSKYKLFIIDEIGYLPIGEQEAKMFFQLIDRRYEKKSTIVTSNINLADWNQIFVDNLLANAILDRLVHHSTIVTILGNSYRTATALSKISDKNN